MAENAEFPFRSYPSTIETYNISNINHLKACFADLSEVVLVVSPNVSGSNTILTDIFKAHITYSNTGNAGSLTTYSALTSNLIYLYY